MNYVDELFFDEPVFEEPDLDDNYACPRCNTEFDTIEDLEYIEENCVCPICLADLHLQATEETTDI
jgi:rubredoxin